MKKFHDFVFLIVENFLVIDVIKMADVAFVLVGDTIMNVGASFMNALANWWWDVCDIMLRRIVGCHSSMKIFSSTVF